MIITRDMLVQKGADQDLLDDFDQDFPNGFDCDDSKMPSVDGEFEIMTLIGYTGLVTHEENVVTSFCQHNYVNGLLNDLPNGNPAAILLYTNGKLHSAAFYKNGKLQNPAKNLPATLVFYPDGILHACEFYENSILNDPFPGIPARIKYDFGGNVISRWYYTNGVITTVRSN